MNIRCRKIHMWLDLWKPALMSQELKPNLRPNINDRLMHCLETLNVWLYIARSTFTEGFCQPCKTYWCITGPVRPLGSTNQSWCGVKLLTMSISTHPVGCVHICHLLRAQHHCQCPNVRENPPLVFPPTPTAHPSPYTRHVWYYRGCKKLSQKNYEYYTVEVATEY